MVTRAHFGWVLRLGTWLAAGMATTVLAAPDGLKGAGKFNPDHETVDFFTAIEEGRLEAKLIPRDSRQCSLLIEWPTNSAGMRWRRNGSAFSGMDTGAILRPNSWPWRKTQLATPSRPPRDANARFWRKGRGTTC